MKEKPNCGCTTRQLNDFNRSSKLNHEQQLCLVNKIQVGTHFEVFCPNEYKSGWYKAWVKSVEWIKNQLYFCVEVNNGEKSSKTRLHLEHCRLRKLKNLNETSIDRSDLLLKGVGSIERNEKNDVEANSSEAMDIDVENMNLIVGVSDRKRRKPPLKNIVKPRDNKGDFRRKWCPVKTWSITVAKDFDLP